jgi:hypothetical protein
MILDRLLMRYLRWRGWVVFWLDPESRRCNGDVCWMRLYESERIYKPEPQR